MKDLERTLRSLKLYRCRSDYERQQLEREYDALDRGRWQGVAVCCALFIPAIMALTYALVSY